MGYSGERMARRPAAMAVAGETLSSSEGSSSGTTETTPGDPVDVTRGCGVGKRVKLLRLPEGPSGAVGPKKRLELAGWVMKLNTTRRSRG